MRPENQQCLNSASCSQQHTDNAALPLLIADGIHVLNPQVFTAILNQDGPALAGLVRKQLAPGVQALAVNLGPGKEMGRLTPWVVDTIRKVTDRQLFFSANIIGCQEVLKAYGPHITINAITANPGELERTLKVAGEYGSGVVVFLVRSGQLTAGIDDKIQLAMDILDQAVLNGFPLSQLYLDPVLTCRPDLSAWLVSRGAPDVGTAVETIRLVKQLDSEIKTIVALGNSSVGMTKDKKCALHARVLSLLTEAGVDAVLCNCLDKRVVGDVAARSNGLLPHYGQDAAVGSYCKAV